MTLQFYPDDVAMSPTPQTKPVHVSLFSYYISSDMELATNRSCNTILVADLGSKHEPDGFLIAEWYVVPCLYKIKGGVADVFEA